MNKVGALAMPGMAFLLIGQAGIFLAGVVFGRDDCMTDALFLSSLKKKNCTS